MIKETTCG